MKRCFLVLMTVWLTTFVFCFGLLAEEIPQKERGKEEILFMEIPTVIASSKREQPMTEAASNVVIVTAEDIKMSGANNIADALRSVAGVDVREAHASQHVIGIRGFADTQHVLVTIDGDNVFMYHANHIFLDWAPIDLEEIDRIEIIKGPGAIFYGGNAFSGVINIITKKPDQLKTIEINSYVGTWDTIRSNIIHSQKYKDFEWSGVVGYREGKEWELPKIPQERKHYDVKYFSVRGLYHLDEKSTFTLTARRSEARNVISRVCNPNTTMISARFDRPDFWVRFFYNKHVKTFWNDTYSVDDANYEVELLRTVEWGRNTTSFGSYLKRTGWKVERLIEPSAGKNEKHRVWDYAINVENECRITDKYILTLGARGEYYTPQEYLALGRASFVVKPTENQDIRFTVASGYYLPSLFEQTNQGTVYPFALGDFGLDEERIYSYEIDYYRRFGKRLKLEVSIFYNDYHDLIDDVQVGPVRNVSDAHQYGGEVELDFRFTDWLWGFANYAYQAIHRHDFSNMDVDPENKVNWGLKFKHDKWSASFTWHYVDVYHEIYLTSNPVFGRIAGGPSKVRAYNSVDARIAYKPIEHIEFSVAASNLFKDRHYESNSNGWHQGDVVDRRIMGGVSIKF